MPSREHLKHERVNSKVDMCCVLAREKVIGPFSFDEDIITAILNMLKIYAVPQLNNNNNKNLDLQLDSATFHFAHTIRGYLNVNFPGR
jgi:hypothetical protein